MAISTIQDEMLEDNQGVCKAWVNFNGTGTVAIRDSYNVSSITDIATGRYTVNFTTGMSTANYCAVYSAGNNTVSDIIAGIGDYATTSCRVTTRNGVNTDADSTYISVAIFGG